MKRLLLFGCTFFAAFSFAQTTIYQENFETGNTFTMNTTDLGGASTFNTWLMNNTYAGGSGTLICMGFPFSFTVANTPSQPVGITNAPSSNYMHISAQAAVSSGITCASYIPSDGGTCVSNESNFTKMTASISTLGFTGVTFDFWWMCAGSADAYGEVYYSLNGGSTWTLKQSNLNNVTSWSQTAISDPAWDNQSSLMFAFRFVNNTASTAADPAFAVDELLVTGMSATNSITVDDLQPINAWCFGDVVTMQLTFTSVGTYNSANVYTAQISDANGSFALPTDIGFINSSTSGTQLMPFLTIPGTIPAGTGYRIRVVASDPATIGSDNGSDLIVFPLPTVTSSPYLDVCLSAAPISLTGGAPSGGSYAGNGVSNGNFNPSTAGVGTSNITYTYVDLNGCSNSVVETITVLNAPTAEFVLPFAGLCDIEPPYTFTEGTPAGGTYSGPGVTGGVFDPGAAGIGSWVISYSVTDPTTGCSDSTSTILQVTPCFGLNENASINYSIFPNPAEGNFSIVSEIEFDAIELKDLHGRVIRSIGVNELIDVSQLSAGAYIIEMNYLGERYAERIVIK